VAASRALCDDDAVPRLRPTSPIGVALTAYELWRRLPKKQRKQLLRVTRTHGPKLAAALLSKRRPR
jgi:hypothetical protein